MCGNSILTPRLNNFTFKLFYTFNIIFRLFDATACIHLWESPIDSVKRQQIIPLVWHWLHECVQSSFADSSASLKLKTCRLLDVRKKRRLKYPTRNEFDSFHSFWRDRFTAHPIWGGFRRTCVRSVADASHAKGRGSLSRNRTLCLHEEADPD